VRDAEFVMAHMSTAVSFAVIARKPLIFLNGTFYQGRYESAAVDAMAAELGKKPLDLGASDPTPKLEAELTVDEGRYSSYENKYIKTADAPDQSVWETFGSYLRSLNS
jgi:hypothetical protein